jgi:hypothetical protein
MLDENTVIPKARLVLFDWFIFAHPMGGIKLDNVRRMIYEIHPPWNILYVHNGTSFEREVLGRINDLGVRIYDEYDLSSLICFSDQVEVIYSSLRVVDVAYIPRTKTLPVNFLLKSPRDDKQALEIVCYFANSLEPFTTENYNKLLATT